MNPWQGHFGVYLVHKRPQSHDLSKLGRVPLGDATYQIVISDKKLFFSIEKHVNTRMGLGPPGS